MKAVELKAGLLEHGSDLNVCLLSLYTTSMTFLCVSLLDSFNTGLLFNSRYGVLVRALSKLLGDLTSMLVKVFAEV